MARRVCIRKMVFKERKDAEALIAWLWERENGSENSGVMQSEVSDAEKADAGLMGVYNTSQGTILKVEKKRKPKIHLFSITWRSSRMIVLKCLRSARIRP